VRVSTNRRIEYQTLDSVRPAPRNPKNHNADGIAASVDRHGFVEPVLMDERTGFLVAGHGRLAELRRKQSSGEKPPDGIAIDDSGDWTLPVIRGWASKNDREAEAYLLAANQLTVSGGWESDGLAAILSELHELDVGLAGTGFEDDDLTKLLASLNPIMPSSEPVGYSQRYEVVITCEDESQQINLLQQLSSQGLTVRAIVV
jgi:hypothetical protein